MPILNNYLHCKQLPSYFLLKEFASRGTKYPDLNLKTIIINITKKKINYWLGEFNFFNAIIMRIMSARLNNILVF